MKWRSLHVPSSPHTPRLIEHGKDTACAALILLYVGVTKKCSVKGAEFCARNSYEFTAADSAPLACTNVMSHAASNGKRYEIQIRAARAQNVLAFQFLSALPLTQTRSEVIVVIQARPRDTCASLSSSLHDGSTTGSAHIEHSNIIRCYPS